MRILFAGTPDIAVPALRTLAMEHNVVGVLTNPDRPKGRGKKIQFSPVKEEALALNLRLFQPEKLDEEFVESVKPLKPEVLVCLAYGRIFSSSFLKLFPAGGINFHPSPLPEFRGPSPLNSIILKGDRVSAVTVQTLAREMDAGDILLQEKLDVSEKETLETLSRKAAEMAGPCFLKVLKSMEDGSLTPRPQENDKASYCRLIGKKDGLMDWSLSALELERIVRAYYPWPLGHTFWKGKRLNILEAHAVENTASLSVDEESLPGKVLGLDKKEGFLVQSGKGILALRSLQLQSKKALDFKSFNNGAKDFTGSVLGENYDSGK